MGVGDAFLSAFLQVLFDRLASKSIIDVVYAIGDLEKVLKKLKKTMLLIKGVLNDAEDKQVKNKAVRMWLDDLKDVAYDAEDVLDEFSTEVLRKKLESILQTSSSQVWKNLVSTSLYPSTFMFNVEIESQIKGIAERLDCLANERQELGLSEVAEGSSSKLRETSSLVNESCVFGRNEEKEKILELMMGNLSSCDNGFSVIPIVGMAGVGKTTLAQIIFNNYRVNEHFDVKAWVFVSDDSNVKIITGKILESATFRSCHFNNLNQLQFSLKDALNGKKFLIVLDDVWNKNYNEWTDLKAPFKGCAPGSSVIVTTRSAEVARMMGTVEPHFLANLSDEECLSVSVHHACKNNNNIDANLTLLKFGKIIAEKCKGLPLAATTIGGVLCSKKDENEWENVLNCDLWGLTEEESDIFQRLRSSYNHLPSHLKRCFAYSSILPKGYEFGEKEIVLLWMAEGFLEQRRQKQMEEVGHEYFQDLLSMSLFQKSTINGSLYVMHDLISDLAQWVSGETCFKLDRRLQSQTKQKISKTARYSSYTGGEYDGVQMFETFEEAYSLRTFLPIKHQEQEWTYITNYVPSKLLPELSRLRVLSMRGYFISKLPDSISNLKHLRYLNLSWTNIRKLPESVSSLYNLQTLLLRGCFNLEHLPSNLGNLINLRHLDVTKAHSLTGMPQNIGKLTHLQTLSNFILGKSGIGELMKLSNLQGVLSVSKLQHVVDAREAGEAMLNKKVGIDLLKLKWSTHTTNESHIGRAKDVLQMLQPHKTLKKLSVEGYGGSYFPEWVGDSSFSSLVFLKLKNCANCASLPALGCLHALKELHIIGMKEIHCIDGGFYGEDCLRPFASLERLHFMDMEKWKDWFPSRINEQLDTFSCLQELSIVRCPQLLGKLPDHLPSLEHLLIHECEQLIITISSFPLLCKLEIDGCKGLVLSSAIEFSSLKSMVLSRIFALTYPKEGFLQGFRRVEELKVIDCDQELFAAVSGSEVCFMQHPHDLSTMLKAIEIRNCGVMKYIPKALMFHSSCLERLYICNCDSLLFVARDQLPPTLKSLEISNCKKLRCLLDNGECSSSSGTDISLLEFIYIGWCPLLTCLSSSGKLPGAIKLLFIWNCSELTCLSLNGELPRTLRKLEIQSCPKLESMAKDLHGNTSLESIQIWNCENLKSLPEGLHCLKHLEEIKVIGCPKLVSFPEEGLPTSSLKELCIMSCERLEALPSCMNNLTSLEELEIGYCPGIKIFPEECFPSTLTSLWINDHNACKALFNWGLYKLTCLKELTII